MTCPFTRWTFVPSERLLSPPQVMSPDTRGFEPRSDRTLWVLFLWPSPMYQAGKEFLEGGNISFGKAGKNAWGVVPKG